MRNRRGNAAWAIERVDAAHGAVRTGLLPVATALMATVRAGERPSLAFWLVSRAGLAAVLLFAASMGGGAPTVALGRWVKPPARPDTP